MDDLNDCIIDSEQKQKKTIVHLHNIGPHKWLAAWPIRGPRKFTSSSRPPIVHVSLEEHTQTDVNLPEHLPTNHRRGAGFCCVSAQWYNLDTNLTYLYYDGCQGQAFWDICDESVPLLPLQIYSARDLEDNLNKIREICSDDKHDWDQRANAVSRFTLNAWNFSFFDFDCHVVLSPYYHLHSWRRFAHS